MVMYVFLFRSTQRNLQTKHILSITTTHVISYIHNHHAHDHHHAVVLKHGSIVLIHYYTAIAHARIGTDM